VRSADNDAAVNWRDISLLVMVTLLAVVLASVIVIALLWIKGVI
jgi:hypothetical protein